MESQQQYNQESQPMDAQQNQQEDINFYGQQQQPIYQNNQQQSQQSQSYHNNIPNFLTKTTSDFDNKQQQRSNLKKIIAKQTKHIQQLICLSNQWATIYYYLCGWNMKLVQQYLDSKNTYKNMLGYQIQKVKRFQNVGKQQCLICAEQGNILQNICGDSFCINCWKGQIMYRMKDYSDPFPPCLNQDCKIRISPLVAEQICKNDQQFSQLYTKTLCRSYSQLSKTVKVCFGLDCTNCFFIKKPFQITQCRKCQNFICLRCGSQHHFPAQCYDLPVWKKLSENSTLFVEEFNYRICPKCKQAVQRKSGCNSMICRCKNQFCYICGQNWIPNHQAHGHCYRQKQVKQQQAQRKKKLQNEKQFSQNLTGTKAQQDRLKSIHNRLYNIGLQQLKDKIVSTCKIFENDLNFMGNMLRVCRLGILYQKYGMIHNFMQQSLLIKSNISNLKKPCEQIEDFIFDFIPQLLKAVSQPNLIIYKRKEQDKKKIMQMRESPQKAFMRQKQKINKSISEIEKFLQLNKK